MYPSNVGHGHILQMLKLQIRVVLMDRNISDLSFKLEALNMLRSTSKCMHEYKFCPLGGTQHPITKS